MTDVSDHHEGADVLVVGAGIVGAAVARALAVAGLRVCVLERGAAASATSASGEGNLLVSDKAPGPELTLAVRSLERWAALVQELADELGPGFPAIEFDRKGGLVVSVGPAPGGAQALLGFAAAQRSAGVDARPVSADQALALEPTLTPSVHAAVFYPDDAQLQPLVATEALLASARRHGVTVRLGVEVTGPLLDSRGALVGVATSAGDVHAHAVVNAAGPWAGQLAHRLGAVVPVRPRRGMVLVTARMPSVIRHKVYDGDYVAAVDSGDPGLVTSAVVESTASGTVLIGSSRQQIGFDARLQVGVLSELAAKALALFPALGGVPVIRAYGGFRPYTPDHLPLIGPDPRREGLWHACGHEGAGIGLAAATADLLADALLGRDVPELAPFGLGRASLAAHLAVA